MAAAIILIPEMLSGPSRDSAEKPAQAAEESGEGSGEAAIKTYTIDLSKAPGSQPPTPVEQTTDNRAPPPEEVPPPPETPAPAATTQVSPEPKVTTPVEQSTPPPVVASTPPPESKPEPREAPARQIAAQPARAEAPPKPEPKVEPKPESSKPAVVSAPAAPKQAVPTGKGWAVQLVTYASEATAQQVANEWRGKRQSAFVMPVTTGGKTLYRVRIGPTKDRASADAVLKAVKPSMPGAVVVAHP